MKRSKLIYLIGSLRNSRIAYIGQHLRQEGFCVFDDWFAAGSIADEAWRDYEIERGHSYIDALQGWAASHVFQFDLYHLNRADIGLLVLPAGKSGHLELGYLMGQGKPGYVLLDKQPERWDVMLKFAKGVFLDLEEAVAVIRKEQG